MTPEHFYQDATASSKEERVKICVPNETDEEGNTVFIVAAMEGKLEVVQFLFGKLDKSQKNQALGTVKEKWNAESNPQIKANLETVRNLIEEKLRENN